MTPSQCRAARALLGWSQENLAQKAGCSRVRIAEFEQNKARPYESTLEKISSAFEVGGVLFVDPDANSGEGVRFRNKQKP